MALTGTGTRIGTASDFGVSLTFPRGLATDGTTVWIFSANKGFELSPITGLAFEIVAGVANFNNSESRVRSATYHNNQVLFYGNSNNKIQVFNTTTTTATDWHSDEMSYSNGGSDTPDLWGLASLDGVLYAADRTRDALFTVSTAGVLTQAGSATEFGISASNPRGFAAYRGMLIAGDGGLDKIFSIDPTTGVGTIIANANALPDNAPEALLEFNSQLLMAGSQNDALFRLYDVLWDETIADFEVDEGGDETWSLSELSQDAGSFSALSSLPNWLSISGTDLVSTNAPAVSADQNNDVMIRATRDGINVDKTLRVVVKNAGGSVTPTPLAFDSTVIADQSLVVGTAVSLTLPSASGGTGTITYSLSPTPPAGVTFTAGTRLLSGTPTARASETTYTYTATDGAGSTVEIEFTITVTADDITFASTIANQSWVVGTAVNLTLPSASGGVGTLTPTLSPALPSGVTFTAGTRRLSGTPTATFTSVTLSYTMTDAEGVTESITFTIVVTAPPPPVTDAVLDMSVNPQSVTAGGIATVTFSFDKAVGDFTDTDVNVSAGATKGTLTRVGNTNVWTLPVTAPSAGSGTVTVSVGADVVAPGNNADSVQFAYTAPPPAMAPSAPQNVRVELTPTTALVKWAAATDGVKVDEYEVSYAEGASPGTTWVATGSTGTRFFVKRLKRGTQHTFGVRGRNSEGAGATSRAVTQNTPIASLHNALFFKECVNYFDAGGRVSVHGDPSNIIRAVADNDYKTFAREKDLVLNIAVNGNPTRVDAIFVKGIDIEGHSAEPTGGIGSGYSNRMMPATVKNWEGTDVSTIVNGVQHDLYLLDGHFTAMSVRMTFTGANAKITEIMLLEFGISIDANGDFTEIATNFVDRTGVVHPDAGGGIVYDSPIGNQRDKWEIDYVVRVVPGKTLLETPEEFLYWRSENRNHVFCMEPSRFPWRVFPATFVRKSVPVRYRTDDKTGGEFINFRISEQ